MNHTGEKNCVCSAIRGSWWWYRGCAEVETAQGCRILGGIGVWLDHAVVQCTGLAHSKFDNK